MEGTIASLFIGTDFSRIDIYSEGNLVMTRDIRAGLNSLVDALAEGFNEIKTSSDGQLFTPEEGRKILQSLVRRKNIHRRCRKGMPDSAWKRSDL